MLLYFDGINQLSLFCELKHKGVSAVKKKCAVFHSPLRSALYNGVTTDCM